MILNEEQLANIFALNNHAFFLKVTVYLTYDIIFISGVHHSDSVFLYIKNVLHKNLATICHCAKLLVLLTTVLMLYMLTP